ncbi:glutathione S-transferase family protein [Frigidibacter sp. ROC022]|uniref:glutathione S-transferase family protein n=1 Tax=Frigidibacter sp. ROC022 TaxID=2971796 RepID=UPI00215A8717|nr:glutathione S-transferase family protein [Frigidibacter sp. ROC022]MCR8724246.1 glutathione S-transferase family protein [Frigidibacter sp. ROC022]
MTTDPVFRLYQLPGWGSAIPEAQLAFYGLGYELIETGNVTDPASSVAAIREVNPLGQLPVLDLPDGTRMTETAAMTLHLADLAGSEALVPGPKAPERADFLRWLIFIVANIYPCFTFAEVPTRYVSDAEAGDYRERVTEREKHLWRVLGEAAAARGGPWVLGQRFSALDIYVAVMANWRPGPSWFGEYEPGLLAIAQATAARPELAPVFARNFPAGAPGAAP